MIKGILKGLVAIGLGLALVTKPASAQKPGLEFGSQFVGFSMFNPDGDNNNVTSFGLGNGDVSVAWYVNEMIAIEPTLVFAYAKNEGATDANHALGLQVAVPIYLKKGWGKAGGLFIAPHVGINSVSIAGASASQNHFGANVGTKLKISNNLFWRVQGGFDMGMENLPDFAKSMTIGASFGMSAYLH